MANFAITGVAGYIAPRHLSAIKETGNTIVAALDPHDSVGILDSYFPEAAFFTEFERFDRHLEMMRRDPSMDSAAYVSICSPNYLHDAHARLALRIGASAICEKPLVINPWNLDALAELEEEYQGRIYTVLQLRVHPKLLALREQLIADRSRRHRIRLTYITSRGNWYRYSWKGDVEKSGGLAANIGIHFFDLLMWLFGGVNRSELHLSESARMGGALELERADVQWFLSVDSADLPGGGEGGERTYRSIVVDGQEVEFSGGFRDLHTRVYEETLIGRGFGIEDARPSIELVHRICSSQPVRPTMEPHPFVAKVGRHSPEVLLESL